MRITTPGGWEGRADMPPQTYAPQSKVRGRARRILPLVVVALAMGCRHDSCSIRWSRC